MRWTIASILVLETLLSFSAAASAQKTADAGAYPWEGEVTGTNVFIRSGAGPNWYPTMKVGAGDRVLVLGEKFGWYQIAPPTGSFSYIDMNMVDRKAGAKSGIVKQDKVYVRAGGKLDNRKSSTQVVLNKGASVEIIGEADGFFEIKPPNGATLFISKQYVKPVPSAQRVGLVEKHVSNKEPVAEPAPQESPPMDKPSPAGAPAKEPLASKGSPSAPAEAGRTVLPADTDQVSSGAAPTDAATTDATQKTPDSTDTGSADNVAKKAPAAKKAATQTKLASNKKAEPASTPPPTTGRYKAMLTIVEGELADVTRRPFDEQDFAPLIQKYEPIANQTEESLPAQIAQIRIRQLKDRSSLRLAREEIAKDTRQIENLHADMDKERIKIMNRRIDLAAEKYELEGELRESFAFSPENRRYRLVDRVTKTTIAYVDIPPTVDSNPKHLIGQFVGIRTSGNQFSPTARVPIAVAKQLVDLSPRLQGGDRNANPPEIRENIPPPENNPPVEGTTANREPQPAEPAANGDGKPQP